MYGEQGRVFLTRLSQYSDPLFRSRLHEVEKFIAEKGPNISLGDLEEKARSIKPDYFFYINQDAIAARSGDVDRWWCGTSSVEAANHRSFWHTSPMARGPSSSNGNILSDLKRVVDLGTAISIQPDS
jgi:hypothetical protein